MNNRHKGEHMSRRRFVHGLSATAAVLTSINPSGVWAGDTKDLTAGDLNSYLNALGKDWINHENTVDTLKSGGPDDPVKSIAVAWMSYTNALEKALELGCNIFVTHEPTYYDHHDSDKTMLQREPVKAKREFIEKSKLTIIRCHDVWDRYPEIGIPTSWGTFLELGEPIDGRGYYYVYDGGRRKAVEIARKIAARTAILGQPSVQFIGPEDASVKRIVLGTGAITPMLHFIEKFGADMAICSDDGFTYWRDGAYAIDNDFPVALVNHPVSEEFGMKLLAGHITKAFPGIPVHHIPQRCMYRTVTG